MAVPSSVVSMIYQILQQKLPELESATGATSTNVAAHTSSLRVFLYWYKLDMEKRGKRKGV